MGSEFSQVLKFDPGGHRIRCENHQYVIWGEIGPPPKWLKFWNLTKHDIFVKWSSKRVKKLVWKIILMNLKILILSSIMDFILYHDQPSFYSSGGLPSWRQKQNRNSFKIQRFVIHQNTRETFQKRIDFVTNKEIWIMMKQNDGRISIQEIVQLWRLFLHSLILVVLLKFEKVPKILKLSSEKLHFQRQLHHPIFVGLRWKVHR